MQLFLCKLSEKYDSDNYQPDKLKSFPNSIQRVLSEKGSKINIKEVGKLSSQIAKYLTQQGNNPNVTRPLEEREVER